MRELKVYLADELDKRFRKAAMDAYGYGRGSITRAAQEAFLEWCHRHETTAHDPPQVAENPEKVPEKPVVHSIEERKLPQQPEAEAAPSTDKAPVSQGQM